MFDSTESMFEAFERDRDQVVAKTIMKYDVSREYVQRYIDHLYQNHRKNRHLRQAIFRDRNLHGGHTTIIAAITQWTLDAAGKSRYALTD